MTRRRVSVFRWVVAMAYLAPLMNRAEEWAEITVQADKPGGAISPTLYGVFFEEISRAGDGGLYSELIRNRDFRTGLLPEGFRRQGNELISRSGAHRRIQEVGNPLDGWSVSGQGQLSVMTLRDECDQQGQVARYVVHRPQDGIINSGFYGIPVTAGKKYQLLLIGRNEEGQDREVLAELLDQQDQPMGQCRFTLNGKAWTRREALLTATATGSSAKLRIRFSTQGTVLVRYVSLIPAERWNGLPVRVDMVEKLASLKPAFMRFPGGGFVHNMSLDTGWNWKETIGPVERRPGRIGMWGYRSTDGLGYHEYLLLCEAMKMEAVPVVNIGISCMAFEYEVEPLGKMGRWVQDALDAIEYANGPTDSTWGKMRAANGHPMPFNIKYLSIGNECGGESYEQRYSLFHKAIKQNYPAITLISANHHQAMTLDMVDQHFYSNPEWFFANSGMYDRMSRFPKVFVSEFASHNKESHGNLLGALGEAVFMMGMERNSDLVQMCAFAPLFENVNLRSWPINLIVFDTTRTYGIPSYYNFKMFSETRGDHVLPCTVIAPKARKRTLLTGSVGVGTWATQAEFKEVRVVSGAQPLCVVASASDWVSWRKRDGQWDVTQEGALRQQSDKPMTCASIGKDDWSAYTYTLKVRKNAGAEGALIYFGYKDAANLFLWNLGAFGNRQMIVERRAAGQRKEVSPRVTFTMETGRWYDVKIELADRHLCCYLDNVLMHDIPLDELTKDEESDQIFASASRTKDGRIYLRAVNVSAHPFQAVFHLAGIGPLTSEGMATCLGANEPWAENSFEAPEYVSPQTRPIKVKGRDLTCDLPPYSLSTFELREMNPENRQGENREE